MTPCSPSKYAVVSPNGAITYGFRCGKHKVWTRRYSSEELRDLRRDEHMKRHKKPKKS